MIQVPISIGELIDKLSILQVKKNKIKDEKKLNYVIKEFKLISDLLEEPLMFENIRLIYEELIDINTQLWEIEDRIRDLEFEKKFDSEFIDTARKVYLTNDARFRLKNEINYYFNSDIKEVKEYKEYN